MVLVSIGESEPNNSYQTFHTEPDREQSSVKVNLIIAVVTDASIEQGCSCHESGKSGRAGLSAAQVP
jgi:hypothetical protein